MTILIRIVSHYELCKTNNLFILGRNMFDLSSFRWRSLTIQLLIILLLAACGLPRVGPSKSEIYSGSVQKQGNAFILTVNDHVARATAVIPALGFSRKFRDANLIGSDTIRAGDTLGLSIWENVDDSLLAGKGLNATTLEGVQVDGAGYIFVRYTGRIKAAGNSPEAVRQIIVNLLKEQTPDPQVQLRRFAGDESSVSIIGAVGGQGIYVIERPTRTLGLSEKLLDSIVMI